MQRRVRTYATSAALVVSLIGGLTACSDSSDSGDSEGALPGPSSTSSAAPGKYGTLPEPCGAVSKDLLKELLPGVESGDDSDTPYAGEPSVTYDTDRRVGCGWKSSTTLDSRHLSVDLERVVSYDPAISDDEQAELLYDERASKAGIPAEDDPDGENGEDSGGGSGGDPSGDETGSASESPDSSASPSTSGKGDGEDKDQEAGADEASQGGSDDSGGEPGTGGSPSSNKSSKSSDSGESSHEGQDGQDGEYGKNSKEDLSPRPLDGIGQTAYIDDRPGTGDSGVHRDITVVFRTANVIATVEYDQWLTDKQRTPDSRELQEQAQKVARELASGFDED